MHEHEELTPRHFFRPQKGTCLYLSMLLDLISKPSVIVMQGRRQKAEKNLALSEFLALSTAIRHLRSSKIKSMIVQ
ncbi:hypothetical protein [Okeania sp. KiyG1]|uniref:hypothetical protein n=1 Tax=Okeania sp. KiyG1 TaxID=2720165 RepID=UPI0019236DAA|nr:hypothetical protein [Okeania sp. KiyG1]